MRADGRVALRLDVDVGDRALGAIDPEVAVRVRVRRRILVSLARAPHDDPDAVVGTAWGRLEVDPSNACAGDARPRRRHDTSCPRGRGHGVTLADADVKSPAFLSLNPNNKIPAIIDPNGPDGTPVGLWESGAILIYLAEKSGRFYGDTATDRAHITQWLMFQVSNVGPKFGECGHYKGYAPEPVPYSEARYFNELQRLYGVMDQHLGDQEYLADDYSIADIATFPWLAPAVRELHDVDIEAFPNVKRWYEQIDARPAVQRGMALLEDQMKIGDPDDEAREAFFGDRQFKR